MSTKWPQGEITATQPATVLGGNNISGVYTLDQLNRLNADFGPQMQKSLRFRSSASAYLNRTPASAGNQKTWTWSAWVKRGVLSTGNARLLWGGNSATDGFAFTWVGADTLYVWNYAASTTTLALTSTAVFRDPSSWYHIVLSVDTTQATDVNRVRLYVNGTQYTFGTATWCAQNTNLLFNAANQNTIGTSPPYGGYFDGYLAEINFIDGQALDPSYFGKYNGTTNVWQPAIYTGTYGTNGFHLTFANNASTTTLGYDTSGNGNNWTTNNISLTAGSTYDSMLDVPTNWTSGDPVQARGNYAVLNPIGVVKNSSTTVTISNANLSFSASGGANGRAISTISMPSGKWYAEFAFSSYTAASDDQGFGVINAASTSAALGAETSSPVYIGSTGQLRLNGSYSAYGSTYGVGDVIGVAFDAATNKIWFAKNGTWQASGDPVAGTNPAATLTGVVNSCFGVNYNSLPATFAANANFGQRPFSYTPPTGYKPLCTQNLSIPTIPNGGSYMAATTYAGTGATQSIVNAGGFQPDLVWVKSRSNANSSQLTDSVRGATLALASDLTIAEYTGELSFTSNGFTATGGAGATNYSGWTYVGWQWKAGNTVATNASGSITSQVSANTTAGFSVVTYTGTGSATTVGHGLGIAPSMVIVRWRSGGGLTAQDWNVYHASVGATARLFLNTTAASQTTAVAWNNTAPTSSVVSIGSGTDVNGSAATYVAYCFAAIPGYSAFGSYTGNGSADGPFVYFGFRPRFILIKDSSNVDNWQIFDTSRDPYNASGHWLWPDRSVAESDFTSILPFDMLSNGLKLRNASYPNASGHTFIYAAFAENPFNYSLAR